VKGIDDRVNQDLHATAAWPAGHGASTPYDGGKMHVDDRRELDELDLRLRVLLPETYQDSFEQLEPAPMRSAGLKYGPDGRVAWDQIWGSFCDLAMAGGPPHKGRLLEPATAEAIDADPAKYGEVVDEICRGITLASELPAQPSAAPGWVSVDCYSETMASWLLRAIVMENVAVKSHGRELRLPASPAYRLDKEIKNVVTVIAKTTHYWMGHMSRAQKIAIADLFARMSASSPLIESGDGEGWRAVDCAGIKAAVWMMRAMVAYNVLARREGTLLLVPNNSATDPNGVIVARTVMMAHRLATIRGITGGA
jgi:sirohydrochlorin cobaltochelatase